MYKKFYLQIIYYLEKGKYWKSALKVCIIFYYYVPEIDYQIVNIIFSFDINNFRWF